MYKNRYLKHGGARYTVSPYTLWWDGDFYYFRGYCDERKAMCTFRLDRIDQVPELLEAEAVPRPETFDMALYAQSVFRMYDTDATVEVTLLCEASAMKAVIDKFGYEVRTEALDDAHFLACVTVCASPTFYRWVFGFGGAIQILSPRGVVEDYRQRLEAALAAME